MNESALWQVSPSDGHMVTQCGFMAVWLVVRWFSVQNFAGVAEHKSFLKEDSAELRKKHGHIFVGCFLCKTFFWWLLEKDMYFGCEVSAEDLFKKPGEISMFLTEATTFPNLPKMDIRMRR